MEPYGIWTTYAKNDGSGGWHKAGHLRVEANDEAEACRAAVLLADFIHTELGVPVRVRVVEPDGPNVIGVIERPILR